MTFSPVEEGNAHEVQGTVILKGGETETITGIPAGTTYEVVEDSYIAEGYVSTVVDGDAEATIDANEPASVTFRNTRNVGGLSVTKKVSGEGANEPNARTMFDITVTLTAPVGMDLVANYTGAENGNINVDATADGATWSHTFTLEADETVTFTGLPAGTDYTVVEADYTGEGFTPAYVDCSGTITVAPNATEKPVVNAIVTNTRDISSPVMQTMLHAGSAFFATASGTMS